MFHAISLYFMTQLPSISRLFIVRDKQSLFIYRLFPLHATHLTAENFHSITTRYISPKCIVYCIFFVFYCFFFTKNGNIFSNFIYKSFFF